MARSHKGTTRAWRADQRAIEKARWEALGSAMRWLVRDAWAGHVTW